jgi:putative Mg2+ transporter-C (MgtC) family protein
MNYELETLLRILLAAVLAGLLGWERESTGKPAGLRTHILVGIGAAMVVAIGKGLAASFDDYGQQLRFDPMRLVEAVMVGLGFLGAGTIIQRGREGSVTGLTTAAGLWTTGAVGLAVGAGRELLAAGVTVLVFLVLRVLGRWEQRAKSPRPPPGPAA